MLLKVDDGFLPDRQVHNEAHQVLNGSLMQLFHLVSEYFEDHGDDAEGDHHELGLLDVG